MSDSPESSNGINLAHVFEEYWVVMLFGTCFLLTLFAPILGMGLAEKVPPVLLYGGFGTVVLVIAIILGFGICKTCCKKKCP